MSTQYQEGVGAPPRAAGWGYGTGRPRRSPTETRPFFLTSEFWGTILGILGICITAAIAADFDSHRASVCVTALIVAYVISRGIAKAGSQSRAFDPREQMTFGRDGDGAQQPIR
jgi:hypothetical protein